MEEQLKKIKSLLKFYRKNNTEIELKTLINGGVVIKGNIIKISSMFNNIIMQSSEGSRIKVFFEDIEADSIIPSDFAKKENKNKNKNESRDPISPKLRFEVFKRDKYVCQYCGACGPDVELEIDHVIPVSRGGTDDINNLKTACFKCNRGKGDRV